MLVKLSTALPAWLLAISTYGKAVLSPLQARRLLGSSFCIPGDNATYNYVAVGGRTAGLTVAIILVEQGAGTVAVVEAGTFYELTGNLSQVPATDGYFWSRGAHDWHPLVASGYQTTPQAEARPVTTWLTSAAPKRRIRCGPTRSEMMPTPGGTSSPPPEERQLHHSERSYFANATLEYEPVAMGVGEGHGPMSVTFSRYVQTFATWAVNGLEQIGIPVIKGLESGKMLGQSYCMFTINADTMTRDSSETSFLRKALEYPEYMTYPLTHANKIIFEGTQAITDPAFATKKVVLFNTQTTALSTYPSDRPEVEYITLSGWATLAISIVTPRSRGTLTIISTDTHVQPLIDPNILGGRTDLDVAIPGLKRARHEEASPCTNVISDAQTADIVRRSCNMIYHASCTCSMDKEDNSMAVVDARGRVYGVEGLRVVDADALAEKLAYDISGNCKS
ncbi:GMC oxidoreductase-domain-containing protein [Xylariomycetidae sp. FL2044]|nr:GMC oxidoreductase-domain-containing protein [Xylariomycetidae sp. FL2044]